MVSAWWPGEGLIRPVNSHKGFKDFPENYYRIMAETTNTYIVSSLQVTVLTIFHIVDPQRLCEVYTVTIAIFQGSKLRHKRLSK